MTKSLKTIPSDSIKLVEACFGYDLMFGDAAELIVESIWKTTDGRYLICGDGIIEEAQTFLLIEWFNAVSDLSPLYYVCHPDIDISRLKEEFINSRLTSIGLNQNAG